MAKSGSRRASSTSAATETTAAESAARKSRTGKAATQKAAAPAAQAPARKQAPKAPAPKAAAAAKSAQGAKKVAARPAASKARKAAANPTRKAAPAKTPAKQPGGGGQAAKKSAAKQPARKAAAAKRQAAPAPAARKAGTAEAGKPAASAKAPAKQAAVKRPAPPVTPSRRIKDVRAAPTPRRVPARTKGAAPARLAARGPQTFTVSHLKQEDFKRDGLRPYALYRDLGIAAATSGLAQAHVIRFIPPCTDEVRKRHAHDTELQLVYVLQGWMKNEFEGHGEHMMSAGSCWIQPPGIKHTVLDYSPDLEVLEIIIPADFKTTEA